MENMPSNELLQAKIDNAKAAIEQALEELRNAATDEQTDLWSNRLKQRKEDLRRIMGEQEDGQVAA